MNMRFTPHPAQAIAARLDAILLALATLLVQRLRTVLAVPLANRVSRARARLVALLTTLAAGKHPRQRPSRPGRKGGPPSTPYIPRGRAWIFRALHDDARRHDVAAHASALQFLLHEPATQELLAIAPSTALNSIARTLRPLCHLLGVDLPAALRPPAPKPRPPRPKPPAPPTPVPGTPARPLPRYIRLAVRAWKKKYE